MAMNALDPTKQPTAEESAAAEIVWRVQNGSEPVARMTLPGETTWLVGREVALIVVVGCSIYVLLRVAKQRTGHFVTVLALY